MEDITDPESLRLNAKANRTVSFYGWMRGVPLKNKGTVHIPGKNLIGQYHKYIIIVIMPMVLLIAFIDVYLCKLMHFYASLQSFLLFSFILFIARYYMKVYAYHVKVCYPCVLDIP